MKTFQTVMLYQALSRSLHSGHSFDWVFDRFHGREWQ
jgi:hypothetical protein